MDKYVQGAVEAGNVNGQQYAMPRFIDAGLLFYRTDLVKTPPKTWDDLLAQSKQLKGQDDTQFGYLMQANNMKDLYVISSSLLVLIVVEF